MVPSRNLIGVLGLGALPIKLMHSVNVEAHASAMSLIYVDVADQGCYCCLSVCTSSLHTLLAECGILLIELETQDLFYANLAHDKL